MSQKPSIPPPLKGMMKTTIKTKTTLKPNKKKVGGEQQVQKSPAEFFAENQAIAGFDNLGKSLYTTIRELVENGLDACEAIDTLPDITIDITEYTQEEFNCHNASMLILGGVSSPLKNKSPCDTDLFKKKTPKTKSNHKVTNLLLSGGSMDDEPDENENPNSGSTSTKKKKKSLNQSNQSKESYFLIKVHDNGCGMDHDAIPNLFGRVLSGSKYGVRQTRGKFGLGAKMALIWAKKSSGQPIRVTSVHRPPNNQQDSAPCTTVPSTYSTCVLDIDIYKNEPRILEHEYLPNDDVDDPFIGTEVQVLIAGNWTTYKSRILQYLQQLAIITPYAALQLQYTNHSEPKRNISLQYDRRSEQMPPTPTTVKHHPASVNNIIVQQLIQFTKTKTLVQFLCKELAAVSVPLAKRLIAELATRTTTSSSTTTTAIVGTNIEINENMSPKDLTDRQITRLVQLFRTVQLFKGPDGTCLSPLGEYNLNLGIHKVLEPEFIATSRDKPSSYEGHPFMVEAAVCLGSKVVKEGITVFRFANRIPLLFEGGADVATRVALTKIKWNNYKIDYKRDRVGVFVSIVSTKIPFKGTSKEYIGDDATSIHDSVKRAIQLCCQQLRLHLSKRNALKDAQTRKLRLVKYVPDISRSLFGLLNGMRKRQLDQDNHTNTNTSQHNDSPTRLIGVNPTMDAKRLKRLRLDETEARLMIQKLDKGEVSIQIIEDCLRTTIDKENPMLNVDTNQNNSSKTSTTTTGTGSGGTNVNGSKVGSNTERNQQRVMVPLFLVPLYNLDDPEHDVHGESFTFRPILPIPVQYM